MKAVAALLSDPLLHTVVGNRRVAVPGRGGLGYYCYDAK
jgi:hypothetical protein